MKRRNFIKASLLTPIIPLTLKAENKKVLKNVKVLQINNVDIDGDVFTEDCIKSFKKQLTQPRKLFLPVTKEFHGEQIGIVKDLRLNKKYIETDIELFPNQKVKEGYPAISCIIKNSIPKNSEIFDIRILDDVELTSIGICQSRNIDPTIPKIKLK